MAYPFAIMFENFKKRLDSNPAKKEAVMHVFRTSTSYEEQFACLWNLEEAHETLTPPKLIPINENAPPLNVEYEYVFKNTDDFCEKVDSDRTPGNESDTDDDYFVIPSGEASIDDSSSVSLTEYAFISEDNSAAESSEETGDSEKSYVYVSSCDSSDEFEVIQSPSD
ncbi:hypothetical protein SK128_023494 [Halocaridina rubra]|uniref:Uncharacterized protein n=1 Tax=Halocaridina rubra TaxID=373956 RepID=A0AAN9A8B9_HALRR